MELRNAQKAERRARILAAARDIIAERGYEALSMRDVARAARLTVPTIYNLVGTKSDLLLAAIEEQTARFLAEVETARRATPAARVLSVVDSCVKELLRLPRYYRSLLHLLVASEAQRGARRDVDTTLTGQLERGIQDLRDAGALARWVDPAALARRVSSHLTMASLEWVAGVLSDGEMRSAAAYGTCMMLLGVTRGRTRDEFAERAERAQRRLQGRRHGTRLSRALAARAARGGAQ